MKYIECFFPKQPLVALVSGIMRETDTQMCRNNVFSYLVSLVNLLYDI